MQILIDYIQKRIDECENSIKCMNAGYKDVNSVEYYVAKIQAYKDILKQVY